MAINLDSLDQRNFERLIAEEIDRIKSRPIELSAIQNGRSLLQSSIEHLSQLREAATLEEAKELELEVARLSARLKEIDSEITARLESVQKNTAALKSTASVVQGDVVDHPSLFERVLAKRRKNGESKETLLRDWLKEHPGLARTSVTDYTGGRIKGRISIKKRALIEAAILASAEELGLISRTSSD